MDNPQTAVEESLVLESSKKMLSPFGDATKIALSTKAKAKWINISGEGKLGKTFTCVEIAKQIRTLYFDTDPLYSTTAYEGYFIRCSTWQEFSSELQKYKTLILRSPIKPKVLIVDTLDGLSECCLKHVIDICKTTELLKAEITLSNGSKGNGYSLLHSLMITAVSDLLSMSELLITVTHPKTTALGKEEKSKQVKSLNLIGNFKLFVQQACDANIWFVKKTTARGQDYVALSSDASDDVSVGEGFGIRPFTGLRNAKTTSEFIDWIVENYGEPVKTV